MQTIEVSFLNRRKEKITADAVSFTDAPGWVTVKADGAVVEMIPSGIIKRLKFLTKATIRPTETETNPSEETRDRLNPQVLHLPSRREIAQQQQRHLYTPLISARSAAERQAA